MRSSLRISTLLSSWLWIPGSRLSARPGMTSPCLRRFSPRPEIRPRHAGNCRRPARHRRGRHQVPGPHRRAARALRQGHDGGRCVHALEMPLGAGRLVPRQLRAARRARSWSIPATPTPSPARPGARRRAFTASSPRRPSGCKPAEVFLASTGVIGEPLPAQRFDGVMQALAENGRARRACSMPPGRS